MMSKIRTKCVRQKEKRTIQKLYEPKGLKLTAASFIGYN